MTGASPLAASRAVVFALLVPDPDDPRCPAEFRGRLSAISRQRSLLKTQVLSSMAGDLMRRRPVSAL
jgi:adenine-specific DNA methylase